MRGCSCGAEWGGLNTSHCGGCHETFSSLTWFDKHRHNGACLSPESLEMRRNKRGYWTGAEEWPTAPIAFSDKRASNG